MPENRKILLDGKMSIPETNPSQIARASVQTTRKHKKKYTLRKKDPPGKLRIIPPCKEWERKKNKHGQVHRR